jgi:diguanylate cyclase (GGDEF)-like protein/PAS domain S-box-containing protein
MTSSGVIPSLARQRGEGAEDPWHQAQVPEDVMWRKDFGLTTSSGQASDHLSLVVQMTRDASGVITSIDDSIVELLGWWPEELVGSPSTNLIHPVDQPGAVAAWMDMIMSPGSTRIWRGRYKTAQGSWKWVETENQAGDGDPPIVVSSMRAVDAQAANLEERLQAREHLLAQLSDALPVGVFQVDLDGHVTLTNQNLHLIVGVGIQEVFAEQMSTVDPEYWPTLEQAVTKAFEGQRVDGVAIHIRLPTPDAPEQIEDRVCLLSLRPLTDGTGVVSGVVGCLSDVTEQAALHQELEVRASVDPLTSCLNRATTIELLERTTNGSPQIRGRAIFFVDLDGLKAVNDQFGHAAGDQLLAAAADQIRTAMRDGDFVGRIGGDEFLAICPNVVSATQAMQIAQRISTALTTSIGIGSNDVDLRASIGVVWTTEAIDTDVLIAQADSAMYQAKRLGDHGVTLYAGTPAERP